MPETISSGLVTAKNSIRNLYPWVWLIESDLDGTNCARIAGYDQAVTYSSKTFSPFPVLVGQIPRDAEGSLPLIEVTVSNVTREPATYLEAAGVVDRMVHIYLYHVNAATAMDWGEWSCQRAQVTLGTAVLTLGPYNLFDAPFPARRQHRSRCDYVYGGLECGYDTTLPNSISGTYPNFDTATCDLSLDGGNGCRNHGRNEVANGRPNFHPYRYGGFVGIPKGPARV